MDERQLRQHQCTMTRQELTSLVEEISATRGRGLDHPARGNPWRLEPPLFAGVETLEDEPEDSQHVLAPETAHHGRDRLQSSPRSSKLFVGEKAAGVVEGGRSFACCLRNQEPSGTLPRQA